MWFKSCLKSGLRGAFQPNCRFLITFFESCVRICPERTGGIQVRHFLNVVFFCSACLIWGPVQAQTIQAQTIQAEVAKQVLRALGLSDVIAVMRQEGLEQGDEMSGARLPSGAASDWQRSLEMIYNVDRMEKRSPSIFQRTWGRRYGACAGLFDQSNRAAVGGA